MPELIAALSALAGAIVGFGGAVIVAHLQHEYSLTQDQIKRDVTVAGHFNAISAEVDIWHHLAAGYIAGNVMAPSYRIPLIATERSLAALLAEGELTPDQTKTLLLFYVNARSINLGLDLAQQAVTNRDTEQGLKEHERVKHKCGNAVPSDAGNSLYDETITVLGAHIDGYKGRPVTQLPAEPA